MDENFIAERVSVLRLRKGISEYQMSYDLGHSRGYINSITSGRALPSMGEFLEICRYLDVSPAEFFDVSVENPVLFRTINEELKKLSEEDLQALLHLIRKMAKAE